MPRNPQRDYWDANVFIALFQRGDDARLLEQRQHSIRLLEDARQGAFLIVTSAFTLAEARRGDGVPPLPGDEHATLQAFFKHSYIEVVPVDRAIAELAAEYGERYGLKPGDAVQLATAVRSKVSRFLAWDGDFHRKVAMRGAPITIEYPLRPPDPKPPMLELIEAAEAAAAAGDAVEVPDDETNDDQDEEPFDELDAALDDDSDEQSVEEPANELPAVDATAVCV